MTSTEPTARLRPMAADEFPQFVADSKAEYAHDMEVHGGQTHDAAQRKADDDMAAILPQGLETKDHAIFVIEAGSVPVGHLWLAERPSGGRRVLFVYGLTVAAEERGHGFGRAAMLLAEDEARARGLGRLELNVFGGNEVARGLYRSLGYVETSVQMAKDLDGG